MLCRVYSYMAVGMELASLKGGKENGRQVDCAGAGLVPTGNEGQVEKQGPWGRLVGGRRADDVTLLPLFWKLYGNSTLDT